MAEAILSAAQHREKRQHTTLALGAASVAVRDAAEHGVPEEDLPLIGMNAGWLALEAHGYTAPPDIQAVLVQNFYMPKR